MAQVNVGRTPLPRYELPRDDAEFNEMLRAMWTARQAAGTAPPTVYGASELPADFLNNPRVRAAYLTGLLYWGLDVYEENDLREDDYRVL